MSKKKSSVPLMYRTQIKEIERYSRNVDIVLQSEDISRIIISKTHLLKCCDKLQECYFDFSTHEEFDEDVEYNNFAESQELADETLAKIESFLNSVNNKLKFDEYKSKCTANSQVNIKLPKYDLPTFSGEFESWLSFKSIFLSSIDSNESLTEIQKLQYLQSSVSLDASRLIRGFAITPENYKNAWDTLTARYDNQRELAFSQCKKIFNLKSVKSTSESIRTMIDTCNEVLRNFKTLGLQYNQLVEIIFVFTLQNKLEDSIKIDWELTLEDGNFPSLEKFLSFLERRARSLQGVRTGNGDQERSTKPVKKSIALKTSVNLNQNSCKLCQSPHPLHICEKFLKMSIDERWNFVRKSRICFNCLRANHGVFKCKFTTTCRVCKQRHHTILHSFQADQSVTNQEELQANHSQNPISNQPGQSFCLSGNIQNSSLILLTTAVVRVKNNLGQYIECRALVDSGSQTSLITESCFKRLNLNFHKTKHTILGLDEKVAARASKMVELNFTPHFNQDQIYVKAIVVKSLTSNLPNFLVSDFCWPHLRGLQLADPSFHISRPVDIILGADIFFELIQNGKISGNQTQPSALNSTLGWLLSGRVNTAETNQSQCSALMNFHALVDLEDLMTKFWEIESVPTSNQINSEEQEVEKFYTGHTKRDTEGRFVVSLPFKDGPVLGESKSQAKRRFFSLERKLQQNPELKNQYIEFMKDYQKMNHMKLVPTGEISKPVSECFYLPHFGVISEKSETTRLRVVFDASAKSESGVSLNDALHIGPKLQKDLFDILIKFRIHRVAVTADIEKMYRQVKVNNDDIGFQRIFWREGPEEALQEFQLLTVTYGTACAPYLAIRTLQQLAKEEAELFPEASRVTLEDFYVDDLLTGASDVLEAKQLVCQVIELMKRGGFPIRKWASNEPAVVEFLPEELKNSSGSLHIKEDKILKILGIIWDAKKDTFKIDINLPIEGIVTKRQLLSAISKIYDPLGFLAPTVIKLKILMQDLWKEKIMWDDPVPCNLIKVWKKFVEEANDLAAIDIPRVLKNYSSDHVLELHGFCDASAKAYAAVIYLRSYRENDEATINLLAAKTRVVPLKSISIPRLELCAAVLLSHLYVCVSKSLHVNIQYQFFWIDSQIVLDWIKSPSHRWKTFVANRISQIQSITQSSSWNHVRTDENPADCASRGITALKLRSNQLWWHGPSWLSQNKFKVSEVFHSENTSVEDDEVEEPEILVQLAEIKQEDELVSRYSSFDKLITTVSWCLRFIKNCNLPKLKRVAGYLRANERNEALLCLVRNIQVSEFNKELYYLKREHPLPKNSRLIGLSIFLDSDKVIRVGGRLKKSNLSQNQKQPILLPKKHHFTTILVEYYHQKHLHSGPQLTLCCIRQKFWIPSGRDVVRRILSRCLTCFRLKSHTSNQMMGDMPSSRLVDGRAFLNCQSFQGFSRNRWTSSSCGVKDVLWSFSSTSFQVLSS